MTRTAFAWGAALAAPLLLLASSAWASGNSHVIDDSEIETPGVCHLEAWSTRFAPRHGLLNLSPACTRKAWPNLELGGTFQHGWDSGVDQATLGPAFKLTLRPEKSGLGLAITGASAWNLSSGQWETASLIAPVTLKVNDKLRFNLNLGWSHSRAGAHLDAAFYGAQTEVDVARDLTVMVEAFQRDGDKAGGQAGLRWNPGGGRFDFDLVAGRRIDGATPRAVTLGLTVRR